MVEVTDEMVRLAASEFHEEMFWKDKTTGQAARKALEAVAPLIEAQVSTEIERLTQEVSDMQLAYNNCANNADALRDQRDDLRAELAQARAAAIEDAAKDMVSVPREPTQRMLQGGLMAFFGEHKYARGPEYYDTQVAPELAKVWSAMIAASRPVSERQEPKPHKCPDCGSLAKEQAQCWCAAKEQP